MSKTIEQRLKEAVEIINKGGPDYIAEASGALLNFDPSAGQRVVAVGDTITDIDGIFGTVVGPSKNHVKGGFVDIRTPGGAIMPMQSNLLVPVK